MRASAFGAKREAHTFPMECVGGCGTILTGPHCSGGNHAGRGMCRLCLYEWHKEHDKRPRRVCRDCGAGLSGNYGQRCKACQGVWDAEHTARYEIVFAPEAFDRVDASEWEDAALTAAAIHVTATWGGRIVDRQTVRYRLDGGMRVAGRAIFHEKPPARIDLSTVDWKRGLS